MRAQELGTPRNPLETASQVSVALRSADRASRREIEYLRERAATLHEMALGPMPPSLVDQLLKMAADFERQAAHLEKGLSFSNTAVATMWSTEMLLFDPRLKFARHLIGHWLEIRRGALAPLAEDIDPRELLRGCDNIAIADLMQPAEVNIELAGLRVNRRYGRDIRRLNWLKLVPPALRDAGERARVRIRSLPCGFYYKFTVTREAGPAVTAETLVLPLRHRMVAGPHAVIATTCEGGAPPAGWLVPSIHPFHLFDELVDIGAGVSTDDR